MIAQAYVDVRAIEVSVSGRRNGDLGERRDDVELTAKVVGKIVADRGIGIDGSGHGPNQAAKEDEIDVIVGIEGKSGKECVAGRIGGERPIVGLAGQGRFELISRSEATLELELERIVED